jgi:UDP-glucose 4-epimerase
VYSDVDADEVDEETLLPQPAHLYTAGKLAGELYCRSYAELYGLEPTIVRFGIPYGPRARPAAVIPSFVHRALRGEPLTIAGTGEQERSFVYVEDLADGVVRALAPHAAGRTYNLAGTETTTIRGLAEIVRDEVADVPIVHSEGRAGDLRGTRICSERAERELDWRASTPLREGVRRYAAWFQEQPVPEPKPELATDGAGAVERANTRRLLTTLRSVTRNPAAGGAVALIAVASAALSAVLGAREETQAADVTVLALALLLPLWSLTVVVWPPAHRRLQGALAALFGAFSVLLIGVLSSTPGTGGFHADRLMLVLALSACLTSALHVVPRRLAQSRT